MLFQKNLSNHHGTQKLGEPRNRETVRGWKMKFIDLRKANPHTAENANDFYGRIILYFPSGDWWNLDVFVPRRKKVS